MLQGEGMSKVKEPQSFHNFKRNVLDAFTRSTKLINFRNPTDFGVTL